MKEADSDPGGDDSRDSIASMEKGIPFDYYQKRARLRTAITAAGITPRRFTALLAGALMEYLPPSPNSSPSQRRSQRY